MVIACAPYHPKGLLSVLKLNWLDRQILLPLEFKHPDQDFVRNQRAANVLTKQLCAYSLPDTTIIMMRRGIIFPCRAWLSGAAQGREAPVRWGWREARPAAKPAARGGVTSGGPPTHRNTLINPRRSFPMLRVRNRRQPLPDPSKPQCGLHLYSTI